MSKDPGEKQARYTINSIDKALDLIEIIADRGSLSLLEMANYLDQPKSSTYRIVLTLENRGFICRNDEDGKYSIGYNQLMITRKLLERNSLRSAALAEMKKLSEQYGDTINLGVLHEGDVLYVDIIESTHALRMTDTVGSKSPFHATAIGKAITAHLPAEYVKELIATRGLPPLTEHTITSPERFFRELEEIRQRGFSLDDQEVVKGARCVAAPVFKMFGNVHGAISMSGTMHRFTTEKIEEIGERIRSAGEAISKKLGYLQVSSDPGDSDSL